MCSLDGENFHVALHCVTQRTAIEQLARAWLGLELAPTLAKSLEGGGN